MADFTQKVAVVTGAGSGIGAAVAIELARRGAKLAISDIDTEGLARTEESIRGLGVPVKADRLDVTEREAVVAYADAVQEHFGVVNQIYNIAGIAFMGDIEVTEFKDLERVMDIDFWGVVNGTKAFLPHLIASGDGHVVNMSSMFGLFAVHGLCRVQRRQVRGAGIHRGAASRDGGGGTSGEGDVRPSRLHQDAAGPQRHRRTGLNTNALDAIFQKVAITSPERTAKIILNAVAKNKARVLPGPDAKLFDFVVRLTGSGYMRLFVPIYRRLLPRTR